MRELRLTILNDNDAAEGLLNRWGWSVLLETEGWRALFDADSDPLIISGNARALGTSISGLDFAVLSHDHSDHYGGFAAVARDNPGLSVFVPEGGAGHIAPLGLKAVEIRGKSSIGDDVWSTGTFAGRPVNEHSIVIRMEKFGYVLIVGCSHPGIAKIARFVNENFGKILLVIGGFHNPPAERLREVFGLSRYISPAHCSGDGAKLTAASELGDRFVGVKTGTKISLGDNGILIRHWGDR